MTKALNRLYKKLSQMEGKKVEVPIAQLREVVRCIAQWEADTMDDSGAIADEGPLNILADYAWAIHGKKIKKASSPPKRKS